MWNDVTRHIRVWPQPVVQTVGWTMQMSPAKRRLSGPARTLMTIGIHYSIWQAANRNGSPTWSPSRRSQHRSAGRRHGRDIICYCVASLSTRTSFYDDDTQQGCVDNRRFGVLIEIFTKNYSFTLGNIQSREMTKIRSITKLYKTRSTLFVYLLYEYSKRFARLYNRLQSVNGL